MHLRILIINENQSFCDFLSGLLCSEGHTIECAVGFREALRAASVAGPDLIILEVSQSEVGAVETVQRLKRADGTRHVPVIVIADYPELEYEFLNVFDFIPKPVDVQRLREDLDTILRGRKKRQHPVQMEPLTAEEHQLFRDYLIAHSGLYFERRNMKILERGIAARMAALRIGTSGEYFRFLTGSPSNRQELQKLLTFLTVGETYFFRYHAHFEALKGILATEFADRGQNRIRLWSAGCSTGEEPYSLAITVMETFPDWRDRNIRILATDINNRALKKARDGVYGPWAMRVIEKNLLDHYFIAIGKSYMIRDEVKRLVDFSHLNLQTDEIPDPAGDFGNIDIVFCRNVMIYFPLATTKRVVEKITASLNPGGYLFLGHAETLSQISSGFERHSHAGGFYYRARSEQPAPPQPLPPPASTTARGPEPSPPPLRMTPRETAVKRAQPPPPVQDPEELYRRAVVLFEAEKFKEASLLLAEVFDRMPDHTGALVLKGFIMANSGRFQEAMSLCSRALALDDLLPEAFFLKGMLLDMNDNLAEAADEYRKTILLRMDFIMSHYHLGRLFYRQGKAKEGARELRNTLKILEKAPQGSIIPFSGGLSRELILQQVRNELEKVA